MSCIKVLLLTVSLKELNQPEVYSSDNHNEVESWTTARVLEWARDIVKLPERHILKLQENEITGTFLSFTEAFLIVQVMSYYPVLNRTFEVLVFLLVLLLSLSKPLKL